MRTYITRLFAMLLLVVGVGNSVWCATVTDVLNRTTTGVTGTTYTAWSGKTSNSDAVYAGQSAGGNSSIQLRATSPSGIVTTTSGGKVKKITITWNSNTANGRKIDVYGKNTAYSDAADLYSSGSQGTKLGSIAKGTTSLTISGNYTYVGLRSNDGALYATEIDIEWETGAAAAEGTINFGNYSESDGYMKLDAATDSGKDFNGNTWNVVTIGTAWVDPQPTYCQVGSESSPATSITFTMELGSDVTFTSFSAKFGGFSGSAGTVKLKVGDEEVGNGSISSSSTDPVDAGIISKVGNKLTVTITGISKGINCYYIKYTFEEILSSDKFELVTNASTLAADDEILIVYVNDPTAKAMGPQNTNNRSGVDVILNNDDTLTPRNNAQVVTLEKSGENFLFNVGDGYLYAASSSNNYLKTEDAPDANGNANATISIDGESGAATIIFQGTYTRNKMYYNPNNGSPLFSCYATAPQGGSLPQIYRKIETGTAPTFNPATIANQELIVGATYETAEVSVNSGGAITVESTNTDVATVSWNGTTHKATVTAVGAGTTTIKIKAAKNGDYKAGELTFTVNVAVPTITLNKNATTLDIEATEVLTATTTNAGGATINWSSSDGSVILSDETGTENTITGVSIGSSTITASITVNNLEYSASCEVTIMSPNTVTLKDENGETMSILTQTSIGVSVTLPSRSDVGEWIFVGWSPTDVGTTETSTSPGTIIPAGSYVPTSNIILYPVYTRGGEESLAQTLQYDDWSYSGTTTDKDTYRLFHTGSYIESNAFDLSTLSKVIVYGGTYGGDTNNSLTIGDGSNTWKDVTVSGKSQTGINTYTDGIALTGTNSLRITSNSGSAPGTGVRISKVEIFVTSQTYFIRKPGDFVSIIYNKVTSTPTPADWAGTYLIVYEAGSLAMNGGLTTLDASGNSIGVTIADDKIIASATVDAASFNIASIDGVASKYSILSRSGYYIGRDAGTNGLNASTNTVYQNSLSVTAGVATITGNGGQELRYNYASNNLRFRYYSSDSSQQPIALYKREEALKPMTTIFWGTDEKFLVVNQHWTNSITTNNTTGTKTYSSSNPSVASVDSETGEVVAHAVGTVTITVVIDETESYASGSSSYTLRVIDSNARYYRPVANKAEIDAGIAAGKKFIIATKTGSGYVAMGEIDSDKKIGKCENLGEMMAVPIEDYEMKYLIVDDNTEVNEFTLTKFTDAYSFKQSLDNSYLSHANTDPAVHKIYTSATNSADYQKFYLTYTDGAWAIVNKGTPNWYLQYNTSSPRFCCYINSQVNPMIFMEGLAVAAIGDDFAPDGVWTGETETLSVSVTPVAGYSSGDYTTTWTASNSNITITNATEGAFRGDVAGELEVTILVNPIDATVYSPIAKTFPMVVTGTVTDRTLTLYHETFGDNPDGARDWNEEYSVKSGVEYVYSGIVEYTISNAKQSLNTEGFASSGLNQTTKGTEASIIIGPLNVEGYTNLIADYQWKAGSVKGDYYSSLSYSTTGASGSYTEVTGTGDGTVGYTKRSYSLPAAAQVSTLYLKIVFNTSNTQALIDEVNLSGYASTYGFKVYEGSSKYSMLFVPKISPTFPTLKNNEIAVIEGLTNEQKSAMPDVIKQTTNVVVNGNAYHLKVQDKEDGVYSPFYAPNLLTTATNVSYARTAKEWNSVCLPFSLPYNKVVSLFGTDAEIYQLTAVDANCQVVFTKFESGTIDAGTPVLVKSGVTSWNATELAGPFSVRGEAPITFTPVGNSTVGTAELLGSYKEIVPGSVDGSQLYKLMTTASGQCFGKLSSTGKVYPFRIYLKYTPPAASPAPANLPVKIHVLEGTIGDLNKDKVATLSDLTRMINMVNGVEEKTNAADLDGDGDVNGVDVNRLAKILTKSK